LLTIRHGGAYDRQEYDGEYSAGSHSQQMRPAGFLEGRLIHTNLC
jgi:hypothetical protein